MLSDTSSIVLYIGQVFINMLHDDVGMANFICMLYMDASKKVSMVHACCQQL